MDGLENGNQSLWERLGINNALGGGTDCACKDLVRSHRTGTTFSTRRVVPCASKRLVGWLPVGAWRGRSAMPDEEKPPLSCVLAALKIEMS
jgi:hypothetical protein